MPDTFAAKFKSIDYKTNNKLNLCAVYYLSIQFNPIKSMI